MSASPQVSRGHPAMTDRFRLVKNTGVLVFGNLLVRLLSAVVIVFIARFLGTGGLGQYSFVVSFVALFVHLSDFGMSPLIVRSVARRRDEAGRYLLNAAVLRIAFSLIGMVIMVSLINALHYPVETRRTVYIFGLSGICSSFGMLVRSVFRAFERMEYIAALDTVEKLLITAVSLRLLLSGHGLLAVGVGFLAVHGTSLIVSAALAFRQLGAGNRAKAGLDVHWWRELLGAAWPFALNTLFATWFLKIDAVLISFLRGEVVLGVYSAAYSPIMALSFIRLAIIDSLYPVMSRYFTSSQSLLARLSEGAVKYLLVISIPIAFGITLLARPIVVFLYPAGFEDSALAFQILAWAVPLRFVGSALGTILSSADHQKVRMQMVALATLVLCVGDLALVPGYGVAGACIATLLSEVFLFAAYAYLVGRHCHSIPWAKLTVRPLVASLVMCGLLRWTHGLSLVPSILLGGGVYILALRLLGAFNTNERMTLHKLRTLGGGNGSAQSSDASKGWQ